MITKDTKATDIGSITIAIIVISGDILNIIISTPIIVAVDVIMVVILWLRPVPKVSTSFVILERTSP